MRYRQRVTRLEAFRRKQLPPSHFVMSVPVAWDLPAEMDQETWLQEEITCACGVRGCPELRVGLVVPENTPSPEAWAERAQAYYTPQREQDA